MRSPLLIAVACLAFSVSSSAQETPRQVTPPGAEPSVETHVLKSGAAILQTDAPVTGMDVYLVGFHPMKDDPAHQMEAHHFSGR